MNGYICLNAIVEMESGMTCNASICCADRATIARSLLMRVGVIVVAMLVFQAGPAVANWQFDPILRVAYDFDDNATLSGRTDEEVELSGYFCWA